MPWPSARRVTDALSGVAFGAALICVSGCGGAGTTTCTTCGPPPPTLTLTQVGPYQATLSGINWVVAGVPGFTLLATGTGFTSASVIQWNGSALATQFGSSTGLAAQVTSAMVATPGTIAITVKDSGTTSNSLPFGIASPAAATAGVVALITAAPDGTPANNNSLVAPSINATGRYVSFQSSATNLGAGVTSGNQQIYERDTCIGAPTGCVPGTIPISVTYNGAPVDNASLDSSVSEDGRYVAFDSEASNIIASEPSFCYSAPGDACVYLRDTCIGAAAGCTPSTILVSSLLNGQLAGGGNPSVSPDGRFVGFNSTGTEPGVNNIYVFDTCNAAPAGCATSTTLISQSDSGQPGNNTSETQTISTGGRYVAFASGATNLIPDDTNAGNLDLYLRDTCVGAPAGCTSTTTEEDVSTAGVQAKGQLDVGSNPALSSDGRFLAFSTLAYNLAPQPANVFGGIYLRDTCNGAASGCTPATSLVGVANDGSIPDAGGNNTAISGTGRFVAFASLANNLVPGDTFAINGWKDIFVRDTCFGAPTGCTPSTVRVSVANYPGNFATQSNGINDYPRISKDGHYLVFLSASTNYLASGGNGYDMVYLALTGF
jgi:trimeric autotransporter adhesin